MAPADPAVPPPDDKDWTWTLDRPCAECGFDPTAVPGPAVAGVLRSTLPRWRAALAGENVAVRPSPQVWSPLEYAAHVRDVFLLFDERVEAMLTVDDPHFANWDQDTTALASRYWEQDPVDISAGLTAAGSALAGRYEAVGPAQWQRRGRRSNGSEFTVASLGTYCAHDVLHHLHDVGA